MADVGSKTGQSAPGAADYALLFTLASMWGASFMLIRVGVEMIPPVTLTTLRLAFAAAVMWLALGLMRARLPLDRQSLWLVFIVATFGTALPFNLISWGQAGIPSGLSAIIMGVMPLTTMLLAHLVLPDDRLTAPKLIGVTFGLVGVAVLVGPERLASLGGDAMRQLAIAAAAVCYGASAVATRRMMRAQSQIGLATMIMTLAFAVMLPVMVLTDGIPHALPPSHALAATACLGIVQTGLAQIILFQLVSRQGPSFFSQINFLVPVLGVIWGAGVLGERLAWPAFMALGFILFGLAVARLPHRPAR